MKIKIKTAHGYISFQPPPAGTSNVALQYRDQAGPWEEIDLEGLELPTFECKYVTPVDPPPSTQQNPILPGGPISRTSPVTIPADVTWYPPIDTDYNCIKNVNFNDINATMNFCKHAHLIAYGDWDQEQMEYYVGKKDELISRGVEIGSVPPELYYWERMIGRGCGVEAVAKYGPYAGLIEYEGSLVS